MATPQHTADSTDTTALIVGAGPTGLTLACELARRDIPFRIIEAAPGPQPGSRGKGLQPRTLEMFEDLGIIDRVLANGRFAMPMVQVSPNGEVTRGGAAPQSLLNRPDIPYTSSLITPEWRTEEALRLRLEQFGGAVEFGTTLQRIEQVDGQVTAHLEVNGVAETVSARWLIGCDGGHSIVRKSTGIAFVGETREDVRMLVADVRVDGLDPEAWYMWRGAAGMVTLCPLPSTDLFQYQAGIAPGNDPDLSLANLQRTLEERSGRTDIRLHEPEWTSLWRANIRLAEHYRAGKVFLAGDAAHIHSPAGGQGMNTGIQDAVNLGWKLAAVANGAAESLLDTYEAERRPVAAHVLDLSNARMAQMITNTAIPMTRDASTIQLDIGYRGSSLAHDDRDDRTDHGESAILRAGDRAPDATGVRDGNGTHRLFDLLRGGRFTLIDFGGDAPIVEIPPSVRVLRVADDAPDSLENGPTEPGQIADSAASLRDAYGSGAHTLVLIRPDGYIGVISDAGDINAITKYLAPLA